MFHQPDWLSRLREIGGLEQPLPLIAGEPWSDAALRAFQGMDVEQQEAWKALLTVCSQAPKSAPNEKWLQRAEPWLEQIGVETFKEAVLTWFPLVDKPRMTTKFGVQPGETVPQWHPEPTYLMHDGNADILKALVWLCGGREDKEIARALSALAISAYRKVPGLGPRCIRLANACVRTLGEMPGSEGIGQLALLKAKVRFRKAQVAIDKALASAAERVDLSQDEIEELSVPDYGMQEVGVRRDQLGEFTAELRVTGTNTTELGWIRADGKRQKSVPKAIKEQHAEALRELKQADKDIRKMLPAQSARLKSLYLEQRSWPLSTWRERYLDHPLVGTLARRLIWMFHWGDNSTSGVWHEGQIVGHDGQPLEGLDDAVRVELWHPLHETADIVLAWREWLIEHEIQQPFKQAHREVYLLTDAERETRVYSNRFAAHILKQHQFNALCGARGWKNQLRLMVDDMYPPATRSLPAWEIRAEFWVEGAGDNYGTDTNDTGTYLYLTTDQVRFYSIGARQNLAYAGAGDYGGGYGLYTAPEPLALDQIPPLLFSEIMRDVDLFVGVASVGNDPNWADGGPEGRHRDYWASYSFGGLSETAKTRKDILEGLIPRLKIADRCHLANRFLVVRGDLRTYKIHLGSGNILMEPNDQYLCIVPARGTASAGQNGKVFLPFEGDSTLGIILSKAFLLAADREIKDPTITRQISH
ncbi:MAG: DUF4132 domain-containing protein [Chloroflexota bacterium]|nr:DUF4132 domain-containing protein [Chloroflexota bacterium]